MTDDGYASITSPSQSTVVDGHTNLHGRNNDCIHRVENRAARNPNERACGCWLAECEEDPPAFVWADADG